MKYLIALAGDDLDSKVARRFGHAACHLLVDTETETAVVYRGEVEDLSQHGMERFSDVDLAGVITGNIGPHAWADAQDLGLKVFIARGLTGRQALAAVGAGEIAVATEPTMKKSAGDHHH